MTINSVLLVDDEEDIRTIGEMSLQAVGGWTVTSVPSGAAALEALATLSPDLIILDVMMPGMDGPSTLGKIRENAALSETPVIFMTAKVQRDEVERYMSLGVAGVVKKPFDPMTLPEEIKKIVAGAD